MAIQAATLSETSKALQEKLGSLLTPIEIRYKAELIYEINRLKQERGALILGHNYMEPALYHGVADVVGDSLELARKAAETDADPIIFCGVRFMAETAKILNPSRTVLLPAEIAGCSLAASISAEQVRKLREQFPGAPVVTYINSYADVKAESDVCVTSSTASKIVQRLNSDTIIFIPDEYLAQNVARETGKTIVFPEQKNGHQPEMIGWHGKCEVHDKFTVSDITRAREAFPDTVVIAHPECRPDVVEASDFSGSTSKMIQYVKESPKKRFLLLTECSMADNIMADVPQAEMVRMCSQRCPHMGEITLEDTLRSLKEDFQRIEVPEEIRVRAKRSLDAMFQLSQ